MCERCVQRALLKSLVWGVDLHGCCRQFVYTDKSINPIHFCVFSMLHPELLCTRHISFTKRSLFTFILLLRMPFERVLMCRVGQNHIFTVCIGIFGREITKYTVIYGAYIRFWPTLLMCACSCGRPWQSCIRCTMSLFSPITPQV